MSHLSSAPQARNSSIGGGGGGGGINTAIFSPTAARAAASTAKDWAYVDSWLGGLWATAPSASSSGSGGSKKPPPPFERNPATLRALLALAAANEAADEDAERLARIEAAALAAADAAVDDEARRRRCSSSSSRRDGERREDRQGEIVGVDGELVAHDILDALDGGLGREGRAALDAMADMALELRGEGLGLGSGPAGGGGAPRATTTSVGEGVPTGGAGGGAGLAALSPESLGARFVELQGRAAEAHETTARVALLQAYLDREAGEVASFLGELRGGYDDVDDTDTACDTDQHGDDTARTMTAALQSSSAAAAYAPDPSQPRRNLELQRSVKALTTRLPELEAQVAALEAAAADEDGQSRQQQHAQLTVEDVRADEDEYLRLLARKKRLDAQVKAFAGLPPSVDAARAELDALRSELRDMTERRDANFERLVERESPVKTRKRP